MWLAFEVWLGLGRFAQRRNNEFDSASAVTGTIISVRFNPWKGRPREHDTRMGVFAVGIRDPYLGIAVRHHVKARILRQCVGMGRDRIVRVGMEIIAPVRVGRDSLAFNGLIKKIVRFLRLSHGGKSYKGGGQKTGNGKVQLNSGHWGK